MTTAATDAGEQAARQIDIEHDHDHEHDADRRAAPRANSCNARCGRLCSAAGVPPADFRKRAAQPHARGFAHLEQRVAAPTIMPPTAIGRTMKRQTPQSGASQSRVVGTRRENAWNCGPRKYMKQRNQQAPGQHAAREVQRGEFGSDDVADADVRGADGGTREVGDAARGNALAVPGAPRRSVLGPPRPTPNRKSLSVANMLNAPARKHRSAKRHVVEEILGGLRAHLPRLVNLRRGYRFGERQFADLPPARGARATRRARPERCPSSSARSISSKRPDRRK